MTIDEILSEVRDGHNIVVHDKTFHPHTWETIILDTGESLTWVYGQDGRWLSLDPSGEEILQFEDLNDDLEPEDDTVVYGGDDYEFSYEGSARVEDDETASTLHFREYENADGLRIRLTDVDGNDEQSVALGRVVTEEEVQEA